MLKSVWYKIGFLGMNILAFNILKKRVKVRLIIARKKWVRVSRKG